MKKSDENNNELRPEYDFQAMKGGVRGKYHGRVAAGSNLAFPSTEAVNKALRILAEIAEHASKDQ